MWVWRVVVVAKAVMVVWLHAAASSAEEARYPSGVDVAVRSGISLFRENSSFSVPGWLEANYQLPTGVGVGAFGEFAFVFDEDQKTDYLGRFGAQALVYGERWRLIRPWAAVSFGYGWHIERSGPYATPAPPAPPESPFRTEWKGRPEVGLSWGIERPLDPQVAVGMYVAGFYGIGSESGFRSLELGLRGRFEVAPAETTLPRAERREDDESEGKPVLSAGIRLPILGYGLDAAGYITRGLGFGLQVVSIHFDQGADPQYCTSCLYDLQQGTVFSEGRLFPAIFATPYARAFVGVASLEGQDENQNSVDDEYLALGGELGVDFHGGGLSARIFLNATGYPAASVGGLLPSIGLQFGVLF